MGLLAGTAAATAVTGAHQPPLTGPGLMALPASCGFIAVASRIVLTRAATTMNTTTTKPAGGHIMDAVILIPHLDWNGCHSGCYLDGGCRHTCRLIRTLTLLL